MFNILSEAGMQHTRSPRPTRLSPTILRVSYDGDALTQPMTQPMTQPTDGLVDAANKVMDEVCSDFCESRRTRRSCGLVDVMLCSAIAVFIFVAVYFCIGGRRSAGWRRHESAYALRQKELEEEITDEEEMEEEVTSLDDVKAKNLIVMFYANWCGHCKEYKDEYNKIAKHLHKTYGKPKVTVVKLEQTHLTPDMMNKYGVTGFPQINMIKKKDDTNGVDDNVDVTELSRHGSATEFLSAHQSLFDSFA